MGIGGTGGTAEARVFQALADRTRRSIFERLSRGEATVKELTARAAVSQPAVSQHLAALRGAGLLAVRREGRHVYYRVEPTGLRPLVRWIEQHQVFWVDRLAHLKKLLAELEDDDT
jgi:DNA-binding transcriptional ArsR family regulator